MKHADRQMPQQPDTISVKQRFYGDLMLPETIKRI
jgi:hypothetical protein